MTENVFVYGTLKKGFSNHSVIERSYGKFIGFFETPKEYTMFDYGAFPIVVDYGSTCIQGEVYRLMHLDLTDALEGYPLMYNRKIIELVSPENGEKEKAWIYYMKNTSTKLREVPSGNWSRKSIY